MRSQSPGPGARQTRHRAPGAILSCEPHVLQRGRCRRARSRNHFASGAGAGEAAGFGAGLGLFPTFVMSVETFGSFKGTNPVFLGMPLVASPLSPQPVIPTATTSADAKHTMRLIHLSPQPSDESRKATEDPWLEHDQLPSESPSRHAYKPCRSESPAFLFFRTRAFCDRAQLLGPEIDINATQALLRNRSLAEGEERVAAGDDRESIESKRIHQRPKAPSVIPLAHGQVS